MKNNQLVGCLIILLGMVRFITELNLPIDVAVGIIAIGLIVIYMEDKMKTVILIGAVIMTLVIEKAISTDFQVSNDKNLALFILAIIVGSGCIFIPLMMPEGTQKGIRITE